MRAHSNSSWTCISHKRFMAAIKVGMKHRSASKGAGYQEVSLLPCRCE